MEDVHDRIQLINDDAIYQYQQHYLLWAVYNLARLHQIMVNDMDSICMHGQTQSSI